MKVKKTIEPKKGAREIKDSGIKKSKDVISAESSNVEKSIHRGVRRQENWVLFLKNNLQDIAKKYEVSHLANIVEKLLTFTNLPRKEKSFKNFLNGPFSKMGCNEQDTNQLWNMLADAKEQSEKLTIEIANEKSPPKTKKRRMKKSEGATVTDETAENDNNKSPKKKRKASLSVEVDSAEKQKMDTAGSKNKQENTDKSTENGNESPEKQKNSNSEGEQLEIDGPKKRKRKRRKGKNPENAKSE